MKFNDTTSTQHQTIIQQNHQILKFTTLTSHFLQPFSDKTSFLKGKTEDDIVWLHPQEIADVTKPVLFADGAHSSDVKQGMIGDCWFLSSCSTLASIPYLLKRIVVSHDEAIGRYTFQFYKEGKWRQVTVDDLIPCHKKTKKYMFSHGADPNELWVPLIEKAYAKLYGSYDQLNNGTTSEGLIDLTGGVPIKTLELNEKNKETVWGLLKENVEKYASSDQPFTEKGYLCIFSTSSSKKEAQDLGIILKHAYSILGAMEVSEGMTSHRLVKIRNPWGGFEWSGDWSDSSSLWTEGLMKQAGFSKQDDGTFWMSLEDFIKYFSEIQGVRVFNMDVFDSFQFGDSFDLIPNATLNGELLEEEHYLIKAPENCTVYISLAQYDYRYLGDAVSITIRGY